MTSSVPLFCNQHLTVRNKKVMYLGLIWECGTYALTNLFKIPFWVTTITEPDKGQSVKTKPSSWQFGHMVKTHMAQDYPLAQFKTTYIQCNKNKIYVFDPYGEPNTWNVSWEQKLWNCDIDENAFSSYQQLLYFYFGVEKNMEKGTKKQWLEWDLNPWPLKHSYKCSSTELSSLRFSASW